MTDLVIEENEHCKPGCHTHGVSSHPSQGGQWKKSSGLEWITVWEAQLRPKKERKLCLGLVFFFSHYFSSFSGSQSSSDNKTVLGALGVVFRVVRGLWQHWAEFVLWAALSHRVWPNLCIFLTQRLDAYFTELFFFHFASVCVKDTKHWDSIKKYTFLVLKSN